MIAKQAYSRQYPRAASSSGSRNGRLRPRCSPAGSALRGDASRRSSSWTPRPRVTLRDFSPSTIAGGRQPDGVEDRSRARGPRSRRAFFEHVTLHPESATHHGIVHDRIRGLAISLLPSCSRSGCAEQPLGARGRRSARAARGAVERRRRRAGTWECVHRSALT